MKFFDLKKSFGIGILTMLLWACGSGSTDEKDPDPVDEGKDRKAILTNIADNIILPSYAAFKVKFDSMASKSDAFAAKPDLNTLAEFRTAWMDAYLEWQKVELFEFGPGEKYTIRNFFNIYPANMAGITSDFADPNSNLDTPDSYARQGFPALDYLLFGVGPTDQAVVAFYTAPAEGVKRTASLKRLVGRMSTLLGKVMSEWQGTYKDTFINKTGLDIGSSTSLMINAYVLHYERYIRSGKFGIPSGAMLNGVPAADKVEAYYQKNISLDLAKNAHQAAIDFFNGKGSKSGEEGPSFKTYLNALGAKDSSTGKLLSEIINTQFAASKLKLDALGPNLSEEVKNNNQKMKDVYNEMQKAVRMLKVDMTSAMSITITYTDNDGD
jgi:predicted lipoprotein